MRYLVEFQARHALKSGGRHYRQGEAVPIDTGDLRRVLENPTLQLVVIGEVVPETETETAAPKPAKGKK